MLSLPSPPPPNFSSVLSESKRIVLSRRRHFFGLSVLFLFPICFFSHFYHHYQTIHRHHSPTSTTKATANTTASIILPLINNVVHRFLSLLAVGSITFSAYHGFFGRPVELVSSTLSVLRSFLPLLLTSLASLLIRSLILFAFGIVLFLMIGFEIMGFEIDLSWPVLILSCGIIAVFLLLVLMYLQVNWVLAPVIVVVESSWGFEPLWRSTKLVKGRRRLALSQMLFNSICLGLLILGCSYLSKEFHGDIRSWKSWSYILRIVVSTAGGMVLMLQYFIANTVLYMYCKAGNGEAAGEIDEELAGEYVSLPFDEESGGKVYHVVSVIPTSELGMP